MKNCTKCGAVMQDNAQFCTTCGAPAEQQAPQSPQGQPMNTPPATQGVNLQKPGAAPVPPAGQPVYQQTPGYSNQPPQAPGYQQPPQAPGYQQPPQFNPYAPNQMPGGYPPVQPGDPSKNGLAVASLVMGIVSLVLCGSGIFSILGIIFGCMSLKSQKSGFAKAGLIISVISLILTIFLVIFLVAMIAADPEFANDFYNYYTDYLRIAPVLFHQ